MTRSGTTWLFQQLAKHPEVCTTVEKETRYFRGAGADWSGFFRRLRPCSDARVSGEYDPTYANSRTATQNIARAFPRAKIIFLLRDPVERAFTMWKARRFNGLVPWDRPFLQYFQSAGPEIYYRANVRRWVESFKHVGLFVYDDLIADPLGFAQSAYHFIGVDPTFVPHGYQQREQKAYNLYYEKHPVHITPRESRLARKMLRPMVQELEADLGRDLSTWM